MASNAEKLDPQLWEEAKADAREKFGGHSARAMQYAVKLYKERGGRYKGRKKADNRLTQWTEQDWTTKSGRPSRETGERYLPRAAIESLTPAEYGATSRAKRAGGGVGKVVAQPQSIREKTRKFRKVNPDMATPAQIAARKKFAERARSGELAKMRKKAAPKKARAVKSNPSSKNTVLGKANFTVSKWKRGKNTVYGNPVYDFELIYEFNGNMYSGKTKPNSSFVYQYGNQIREGDSIKATLEKTPSGRVYMTNIHEVRQANPTATRAPARPRTKLIDQRKNNPMNTRLPRVSSSGIKATDKALDNAVAMLSRFLDLPTWKYNDPNAIGAIGINQAYGGVQLVQLATTGGGERDLSNRMTKKELMNFLDGAIMVAEALAQK